MLLAELEVWHSRPIAPTRRVSLGHLILPVDPQATEVRHRARGSATIRFADGRYAYEPTTGDPLGLAGPPSARDPSGSLVVETATGPGGHPFADYLARLKAEIATRALPAKKA